MRALRRTAPLLLVALLGIVFAAAITLGTSQLVRQHIGLSSEPLTAGRRLLPPVTARPVQRATPSPSSTATPTTPSKPVAPAPEGGPSPQAPPATPLEAVPPAVTRSGGDGGDAGSHRDD
jgi:hypothetical protein